jgi:AcrR family transcriptional regulator
VKKITRKKKEYLTHRQEILKTAERVFAAKGFFLSTMHEIAQEAEFGTGTIYKYFPAKEDLYFTLIDEKMVEINRLAKAVLSEGSPVQQRIEKMLRVPAGIHRKEHGFFQNLSLRKKSFRMDG